MLRSNLLCTIAIVATTTLGASDGLSLVRGKWVVKRALNTTNISGLSQREVNQIIGTRVCYSEDRMRSGKLELESPKYSIETLTEKGFADQFYAIPLSQLGIQASSIDVVTVSGGGSDVPAFVGATVFVAGKHEHLIVEFQGVFFELEKVRLGKSGR